MKFKSRLILALDETNKDKAIAIVESVHDIVDAIKINWPIVLSQGPDIITKLSDISDVICDFKVADIPNTTRLIVKGAASLGASAIIVHAFVGYDSLKAAVDVSGDMEVYTVVQMSHPDNKMFISKHMGQMINIGLECGVDGFIAPATHTDIISTVRSIARDLKILSPGVGIQGGSAYNAILAGADYVIIGRSIYDNKDPRLSAKFFANQIYNASKQSHH